MNTKTIVAIAVILAVLGAGYVVARPESNDSWGGMMGGNWDGNGMMGSYGNGVTGGFSGMMGQYTGMMSGFGNGIWNGMMGGYRGMMGYGNGTAAGYGGMMGYDNGNDHCGTGYGYAGSDYGVNTTP